MFSISTLNGTVYSYKLSSPISHYTNYSVTNSGSKVAAAPAAWDYFIFGTAS
jgi:cbb3-type cytochrome oxidase subunit 1